LTDRIADDLLDAQLQLIAQGHFVLTDGRGAVSKWSEAAELLFGRSAQEVLGRALSGLLAGAPAVFDGGAVEVHGRHADAGREFPLEAVFVPVAVEEGFDFLLFLEDLGFALPVELMVERMRRQHPRVVRAVRAALTVGPRRAGRTAGTLVVLRPLAPTPWVAEELARRAEARAAADAEVQERLARIDPGVQGGFRDLEDAAAVVDRLLGAVGRIEALERVAGGLPDRLSAAVARVEAVERVTGEGLDALAARIAQVDRGAGTVLADVRGLAARTEAAEARAVALEAELDALRARFDAVEERSGNGAVGSAR
jgi:hypothetical protein